MKRKHPIPVMGKLLSSLTDEEIETGILKSTNVPIDETMSTEMTFEEFKARLENAIQTRKTSSKPAKKRS